MSPTRYLSVRNKKELKLSIITDINKQLKLLLGMVVIGSIIGIENSQDFGCVIGLEMLSVGNLIFLIISAILIFMSINTRNSNLIIKLLVTETIIWVLKYLFYKDGYMTGFGGTENPINVVYDFIAIGLRIWILLRLVNSSKLNFIGALVIPTLIVALKINIFALPWFSTKMWELEDKRTDKQRIQLIGNYNGTINEISNKQLESIKIRIDSQMMTIETKQHLNLKEKYNFNLDYPNFGGIGTDNRQEYKIEIEKFDKDSLIMKFEEFHDEKYRLKLKTER